MPWECENERHTYEKCVYANPLTRQLTFGFPFAQVPVRRVSLEQIQNTLRVANCGSLQLYASHEGTLEAETCRVRVTE